MQLIKRILLAMTSAIITAGLVAVPAIASAADDDVNQENTDTGANSRNRNRNRIKRNSNDRHDNTARTRQHVDVRGDTGGNEQNKNTESGDQESGEVDFVGTITNDLNQNLPDVDFDDDEDDFTVDQLNDTTGAKSRNTNRSKISVKRRLRINNDARTHTDVDVRGDTGDNEQNKNTTGGNQTSGDVTVDLVIENFLN